MDRKKFRQVKLLTGPLDAESREIHESGLRIDRKLRYEVENRVLPVFYLHLPPVYLHLVRRILLIFQLIDIDFHTQNQSDY
jgi:hypothetical protein